MIGQKGNIDLICAIQDYLSNLAPVTLPVKQGGLDSSLDLNNSQGGLTTPVLVQTKSGGEAPAVVRSATQLNIIQYLSGVYLI
jgi:hypothetical protein